MKLKGKVAFVTGFGSGLGQAIAIMFAKEGAAVAGISKTETKGLETVAAIERAGGQALFRAGDVCDSAQMKALIGDTVKQFGGLDILVNSAGVRTNGSITEISEDDWDRTLDTNLKSRVRCLASGDPRDEKARRRRDSAYCGALRHARPSRAGSLLCLQGRHGDPHRSHGDGSCSGQDPRELHLSRTDTHADGRHLDAGKARALQNQSADRPHR